MYALFGQNRVKPDNERKWRNREQVPAGISVEHEQYRNEHEERVKEELSVTLLIQLDNPDAIDEK